MLDDASIGNRTNVPFWENGTEEVDIEVGFIIGTTCCSVELDEEDLNLDVEQDLPLQQD